MAVAVVEVEEREAEDFAVVVALLLTEVEERRVRRISANILLPWRRGVD